MKPFAFLVALLASFLVIKAGTHAADLPRALPLDGLHAYAEKVVTAGQTIHFRTTSTVPYELAICRLGHQIDDPAGDEILHTFGKNEAIRQPIYPGSFVVVEKPLPADEPMRAITLECWVRTWRPNAWQTLISQHNYPTACGFGLFLDKQGRLQFYLGDGGAYCREGALTGPALTRRQWYHVVGTWDGKKKSLWVDGKCVAEEDFAGTVKAGAAPLRLGACGHNGPAVNLLDGDVSMPAIYGKGLSAAEVEARYRQQGLQPAKGDEVLACWPLDEERGDRVADRSPHARHGRIVNEATWMIGGPSFDGSQVPRYGDYEPAKDPRRGHGLRFASDDLYDCRWQVTEEYRIPETAKPGIYVGRYRYEIDGVPRLYHATFVVKKPKDHPKAPVLVLAATATWAAYSAASFAVTPPALMQNWPCAGLPNSPGDPPAYCMYRSHQGGQPAYKVGFHKPWPNAGPYVLYSTPAVGYSHLMRAERFLLAWLEQSGYDYDMISDLEVHREPNSLDGYGVVVINGHSEYWSAEAFEAVDRYLRRGGNLIVLSGNSIFWRVSYNADGTIMECRKGESVAGGRPGCTIGEMWHTQDGRRGSVMRECGYPAWKLVGLETLGFWGAPSNTVYQVRESDHFLFQKPERVGLGKDGAFGGASDGGFPRAVGHEPDVRLSVLRQLTQEVPAGATVPEEPPGIVTLAEGVQPKAVAFDYFWRSVRMGDKPACQMIYWERPEGGRVFHAGSVGAGWGLSADPKFQTFMRNVLFHFGMKPSKERAAAAMRPIAAPATPPSPAAVAPRPAVAVTPRPITAVEPPKLLYLGGQRTTPKPSAADAVYVKKSAWQESLLASLPASFRGRSSPAATCRLTAEGPPVRLTLSVTGWDHLHFAALGRLPENGSASFLSPRLFDKQGRSVPLELGGPMLEGKINARQASAIDLKLDGTNHRGFALLPGEVSFKLDGKYDRLEVLVCYQRQTGLPPYAAIDRGPIYARAMHCREVWETLWEHLAGDFRDRQSQIEMEMERADGVWNEYLPAGSPPNAAYYLERARQRLELARKTLELVERSAPRPEMARELESLRSRLEREVKSATSSAGRALFAEAVELRRRILFSHPALNFDRLLVSKRPPPGLSAPGDNYYGMHNGTGPGLVVLDDWKSGKPKETRLLEGKLPAGCAMHAEVSFDGRRVVFAYADHTPPRERWQFSLYEMGIDDGGLRRITGGDNDRQAGAGGRMTVLCEDYDPCYLPDGGIAFISTRNQGGVRCHNGDRYCPTYLLYRCDADGANVRQISFGEANEWDPVVMPDGRLLWSRWDYINRPVIPTLGLWTIRPDGTAAGHYFGNYTPNPCRICQPRPIPGSHKVVATTAGHHTIHAGSLIVIDREIAEDGLEAITRLTPEAPFPESEPHSPVSYGSPYPLCKDLFLAEFCPDPYPASMARYPRHNAYGIYLVDTLGGRELVYRDPEVSCFEPLPIQPRPVPPALPSALAATEKPATGVFYLQDVYRSTQEIPRGTIRWLRVNEIIPQPTQRVPYSSGVRFEILKRIVGVAPVDESGSVAFEAPAGVPLQFQALDRDGLAVMTMRTFTHLQPGEQAGCVGCHEPRTSSPRMQPSFPTGLTIRKLEPPAGPRYPGGLSFAKTVQPVLDRYCIECHGLKETAGKIDLLGTIDARDENVANTYRQLLTSPAYASLLRDGRLVKIAQYYGETWYSRPRDYFAHGGTLSALLLKEHEGVVLDRESRQRVIDWLDLNAPFYGTYSWNKDEWRPVSPEGEKALRAEVGRRFGEELARQPFAALVNVALPEESRILKAPLARMADGWGQIEQGGWKSTDDAGYREMLRLVKAAIKPLPYHDIAGTCGRDADCRCLSCWVRKIAEERAGRLAGKP